MTRNAEAAAVLIELLERTLQLVKKATPVANLVETAPTFATARSAYYHVVNVLPAVAAGEVQTRQIQDLLHQLELYLIRAGHWL